MSCLFLERARPSYYSRLLANSERSREVNEIFFSFLHFDDFVFLFFSPHERGCAALRPVIHMGIDG